jgi:hypothetical protein
MLFLITNISNKNWYLKMKLLNFKIGENVPPFGGNITLSEMNESALRLLSNHIDGLKMTFRDENGQKHEHAYNPNKLQLTIFSPTIASAVDNKTSIHEFSGKFKGKYKYANGETYFGVWMNGKHNGQGTYNYVDGGVYVGGWKDGMHHGQGTYLIANGSVYKGK